MAIYGAMLKLLLCPFFCSFQGLTKILQISFHTEVFLTLKQYIFIDYLVIVCGYVIFIIFFGSFTGVVLMQLVKFCLNSWHFLSLLVSDHKLNMCTKGCYSKTLVCFIY